VTIEENKALIRRLFKGWETPQDLSFVDELFAADYVAHVDDPHRTPDRAGLKDTTVRELPVFPDLRHTIEDLIADGDKVVVRLTFRGTHQGEWLTPSMGRIAPTGKHVTWGATIIYRIADGQIVEAWGQEDRLGQLQQLGVIPNSS
jgi:predicted ester cyclase